MTDHGSPILRRRMLAAELRRLRERAGLTGDEAAERLGWSASKVSRLENAKTAPKLRDLRRLFDAYGVADERRAELLTIAREAVQPGWWEDYKDALPADYTTMLELETEATLSRGWEPQLVFGMFQTEAYAREVIRATQPITRFSPGDLESRVEARLSRQRILNRSDQPLTVWAVHDESVLLRQFGSKTDMRAQLNHLIEISKRTNVRIQLLRLRSGAHPVNTGSFLHLTFPDYPDMVYLEGLHSARFLEDENLAYEYEVAFDYLTSAALDPQMSRDLIASAIEENWV